MRLFKGRGVSPAMVVACIALIVALGGTGYAAIKLPKNSVGARQIKKNAVRNSEIRRNAVTASKIKARSLTASKFARNVQLTGPQGPQGIQGPPGVVGSVVVRTISAAAPIADGASTSVNAGCGAGEKAIAGGGRTDTSPSSDGVLVSSRPNNSATNDPPPEGAGFDTWRVTVNNPAGGTGSITPSAFVVCAK